MHTRILLIVSTIVIMFSSHAMSSVSIGQSAPDFSLTSYVGKQVSLSDFKKNVVVLEWYAHDCPFVGDHYDEGDGHMPSLQSEFTQKGVIWLTIDSNRNALPEAEMVKLQKAMNMQNTAFLSDPDGQTARQYGVVTTPQMFVIHEGVVVYQGAIDDRSRFIGFMQNRASAKNYVRLALESVLGGEPVAIPQTKPYGCRVKYAS